MSNRCLSAAAWSVLLIACCAPAGGAQQAGSELTAAAVFEAHLANLDSFERFTYRYTIASATAKTIEDALASRYDPPGPRVGTFLLARDGKNLSQKVVQDEETTRRLAKPPKLEPVPGRPNLMMSEPFPFSSGECLSNSREFLRYSEDEDRGNANIRGEGRPHNMGNLPFGCYGGLASTCDNFVLEGRAALEAGTARATVTRDTEHGKQLVKVTLNHAFKDPAAHNGVWEYWFDPERGFLLHRVHAAYNDSNKLIVHVEYPDPRECPSGRWLPGRQLRLIRQQQMSHWTVRDLKVTEFEVDKKPAKEHFQIKMRAGTPVSNVDSRGRQWFATRRTELVSVDDLEKIYQMTQVAAVSPQMDTAIVAPRSYRWVWWTAGGVAALFVFGLAWRRWAAKQPQPLPGV